MTPSQLSKIQEIAAQSLRANIMNLASGKYLTAGQNQFLTLWTRDFCHAVRGLLAIKEYDVVEHHLQTLLNQIRPQDGLIPRVLDNRLVQFRVAWQAARCLMPFLPKIKFTDPLKPQFIDEHGSCAIDSNLLLLIAALKYRQTERGLKWWIKNDEPLKKAFNYYEDKFRSGLIFQTSFSDWQDSAKREGHTFLTNFFYYMVASQLKEIGWPIEFDPIRFKTTLNETFFDQSSGVYRTDTHSEIVSVDGNLFALDFDAFLTEEEKSNLWVSLKAHPILSNNNGLIGVCSYPGYPSADVAWHTKLAGLKGYHGHLAWSWLMGLGLSVAIRMNDTNVRTIQLELISSLLIRDGEVLEIYHPQNQWKGWESWMLKAERPFAWGSGYLIEALLKC